MKARAPWTGMLWLALSLLPVWPPSASAQQLPRRPETISIDPTINLAFGDIHLASLRSDNLHFSSETKHGQTCAEVKCLPCCSRELRQEPFAGLDSTGPTNTALHMKLVGTSPVVRVRGSSTSMMAGRFEVAHVSPPESERLQRLPALYQEDTPFSTQVRLAVANLWGGRLQFDAFYREISANSMVRGLPQSSDLWWATPGSLTLRPARSYGIQLLFQLPHIRTRTLCRCLLGRSG